MDLTLGRIVQIGLRVIAYRKDIERLLGRSAKLLAEARVLFPEVVDLIDKIAPGALGDLTGPPTRAGTAPAEHPYDVRWLQTSLNRLVDAKLDVDGSYGELTKAAVTEYQRTRGLDQDGWAGTLTLAMIEGELQGWPHEAGHFR